MLHPFLNFLKSLSFCFLLTLSLGGLLVSCTPEEMPSQETDYPHKILFNCNEGNSVAKIYENGLIETLTLDAEGSGEILITNQVQNYLLDSVSVEKEGFIKWTAENQIVQTEISFNAILEEEITEFDILVAFMEANDMDLYDILDGWVISGYGLDVDNIDFSVADYYIMDFRTATDFANGHIKNANNVVFSNLLIDAPADKNTNILTVCYTGQTAARATGFLRLAGYTNAKTLKWGMCAWHQDFETKWETSVDNYASPNWITTGTPTVLHEFDNPSFTTGNTLGEDILEARIQAVIELPWIIDKTELLTFPSNYFINNKWPQACWDEYGHIANAYRIDEILGLSTLNNLNPEESVVTYCYAGQTSSITTAWLQVLGFDTAKSLKYGANGIIYSALLSGTAGAAPKKTWKGVGSGSELNFGYYDTTGIFHPPL